MNKNLHFSIALALGITTGAGALAADHDHGSHGTMPTASAPAAAAGDQAAWLAAARAAYPLDTCVVSGDKLEGGDMGAPIDYMYKEEGKPDRLVRLCCKDCIRDFKKDPAKYLAMIDAAAAKQAAEQKSRSGG